MYDVEEVLRAIQLASDRQKTLAAYGIPMSGERLPIEMLDIRYSASVEGGIRLKRSPVPGPSPGEHRYLPCRPGRPR